jgi:hypothetical protein
MNVLLTAGDNKPEAHQGDVPTSRTETQNVFLCRNRGRGRPGRGGRRLHRRVNGTPERAQPG